jgi:hypothetical protein
MNLGDNQPVYTIMVGNGSRLLQEMRESKIPKKKQQLIYMYKEI